MDKTTAEKVLAISMDCTREMSESVRQVMETCDEETFKIYRRSGGRIAGHLFTEIIAPVQSEHLDLAPPDFKPMQPIERPRLRLTKQIQDDALGVLNRQYQQLEAVAEFVRDHCDKAEAFVYRSRVNEVLVHVAETIACVLAADVEEHPDKTKENKLGDGGANHGAS